MCCVIFYIYVKCRECFKRQPKGEEDKQLVETMYNTRMLNEYVRNKERTYWTCYKS